MAPGSAGRPPLPSLERLVRAALAANVVAVLGGLVASQYVGAPYFAFIAPFAVGLFCAMAASRAARTDGSGPVGMQVRVLAISYALLGTGLGFVAVPGRGDAFAPVGDVLPPYLSALVGVVLWMLPPRRRPARAPES